MENREAPVTQNSNQAAVEIPTCPKCEKRLELCFCAELPEASKTKLDILILQHPQEPDTELGSARLAQIQLSKARLNVGLSWPNLTRAWQGKEREEIPALQPKDWVCIYLGNAGDLKKKINFPIQESIPKGGEEIIFVDKKGNPLYDQADARAGIKGIILLDGTWSQAKTLWWRNAWMLKCRRAALLPKSASLYGTMRKEPRKECLSTIESVALAFDSLGEKSEIGNQLRSSFRKLLQKARDDRRLRSDRPEQKKQETQKD
jgi:DTW domain-containing protein YfiP